MKPKVYIRADGGFKIGLGHLIRCIALAHMLKDNFSIEFVCREIPRAIEDELLNYGFKLKKIDEDDGLIGLLTADDIVVFDGYDFTSAYQKQVKESGAKLVCIDDLHNQFFYADLIINHSPAITPDVYKTASYTNFATGLDYVLLRPPFLKKAELPFKIKCTNSVLVCFGGSDIKNITSSILEILIKDSRFKKINIVAGIAYNSIDELKTKVKTDRRVTLYHAISAEVLSDLISETDIAIVPASGILQESLAVGCHIISGMYVENQRDLFEQYRKLNAFESADFFERQKVESAINSTFKKDKTIALKLIDGKSGMRLLKLFNQLNLEQQVVLKPASANDLERTFIWANSLEIRRYFFDNNPVKFEDHKNWFIETLSKKNCYYCLGFLNGVVFGSIRFLIEGRIATVSYLVDKDYQNRGLGVIILKKGVELMLSNTKQSIECIYADVFKENTASLTVFRKFGYRIVSKASDPVVKLVKNINVNISL